MSYGIRGRDGRVYGLGRFRGLGLDAPVYETCDIRDTACVMRNVQKSNDYDAAERVALAQTNFDQCAANANNASSPAQYAAAMASCNGEQAIQTGPQAGDVPLGTQGGPGGSYLTTPTTPVAGPGVGGRLSFSTSRGGNALQVGDTWLVSITGASPNAPVTVSGSMPGGSTYYGTPMGTTDSSGNFSKSGTVDASSIGQWNETWSVSGQSAGSFSFTVSAAPAGSTTPAGGTPASDAGSAGSSGSAVTSAGGSSSTLPVVAGFDLSTIPWWGWAAAAGVALLAFGGKR